MKTIFLSILIWAIVCIVPQPVHSNTIQSSGALESLLTTYLQIKNSLVKSQSAQTLSASFLKSAAAINTQNLSKEQLQVWTASSATIIKDLEGMSATADLDKQRKYFASLSLHFYPLVKTMSLNTPLYYQYCPMYNKGSYWISELSNIQNPYYGSKMLTCGSTKETLR